MLERLLEREPAELHGVHQRAVDVPQEKSADDGGRLSEGV
jgi:hypothetical protein